MLLFLLAASYGGRGSACLQDSGSDMCQIGKGQSGATRRSLRVHYNQQYNILEQLRFHGKYEGHNFGKNGLAGSNMQTVENTL